MHGDGHKAMRNVIWVLWRMLISPVSGYPYLVGTSDCHLGSVYQKGLPLLPTALKQLLSNRMEAWERQVPMASDLECH